MFKLAFEQTLANLTKQSGYLNPGHPFKFKNKLASIDSTIITMACYAFDWLKYRTRKGGIKIHTFFDHDTNFAPLINITPAKEHDINFASTLVPKGTIVAMDRAYNDFSLFYEWIKAGVFFVTRIKLGTLFTVVRELKVPPVPKDLFKKDLDTTRGPKRQKKPFPVIRDQVIRLTSPKAEKDCPVDLRLVTVRDPEGATEYRFITNMPTKQSCHVVAAVYQERWAIETFFKMLKQNMMVKSFLGTSENAVRCQIYAAMTALLLIFFLKFKSRIGWNISNLVYLLRLNLFCYYSLLEWIDVPHCMRPPPELDDAGIVYHKIF
jgi:hypothetical protein